MTLINLITATCLCQGLEHRSAGELRRHYRRWQPLRGPVAQARRRFSEPAVSPTFTSADGGIAEHSRGAGLETCDTADLEVNACQRRVS